MSQRKQSPSASAYLLECAACGRRYDGAVRFCSHCGLPLAAVTRSPRHPGRESTADRARKINPEYTAGRLVRAASGLNQVEAEMLASLLLEQGVPSVLRRSAGFDVPEFLAAGPRDVLVAESGLEVAHEVLFDSGIDGRAAAQGRPSPRRIALLAAAILVAICVTAVVAWVATSISL